uniref:Uncharacterized protein n=1 Tax=Chlamydomonas euryale TaxID=1486919 RepID=A0A7R9VAW2_9CHLO
MDVVLAVTACRCTGFSSAPAQRWCRILHAPAAVLSSAYLRLGLVFSCLPPLPPLACVSCLLLLLVSGCTMGALALPPTFSSFGIGMVDGCLLRAERGLSLVAEGALLAFASALNARSVAHL